ncbi:short-chain dehydrogenase [Crocosphaera sp.]|uniref:short-chain dehydrogenase n=1 Tax=Crocosphaera sp. TaxID=2729996 RepID=UPI003F25A1A0|nr:short-chain dehydrogenase [Crocosphaera sp.]
MYRSETPSMFNTLEGYENFVSQLLEKDQGIQVDPMLEWEDAMNDEHLSGENLTSIESQFV